jgi:hypothetical protein
MVGLTFLAMIACGHPYQAETVELAGKPGMPSTLHQTDDVVDDVVRATKLVRAAEADAGYNRCLVDKTTNSLYSGRTPMT